MPSFENDDIVRKMKKLFLNLRVWIQLWSIR
jgi:hypothetical protein